jgi:hypothetical protein
MLTCALVGGAYVPFTPVKLIEPVDVHVVEVVMVVVTAVPVEADMRPDGKKT